MNKTVLTQSGAKVQEDLNFNENLFPYFSATSTYEVGSVVRYEDKLYHCHTAVSTAGAWTGSTNWEETSILALIKEEVEITWAELKALRDNGDLVAGREYRITDYQCTTATANTSSANHQFDIIVEAVANNELNENAKAVHHAGDTYFANSDLDAWELKYCLDNDTDRFAWADSTNGKGVVYYMKDEFNNECPYDFKNIIYEAKPSFSYNQWGRDYLFIRDTLLDSSGYYGWRCASTPSAWSNPYCFTTVETPTTSMTLYQDTSGTVISFGGSIVSVSTAEYNSYTFNYVSSSTNYDASIEGLSKNCYNNVMKEYYSSNKLQLNWNIFHSTSITASLDCYSNTFAGGCHSNTFDNNCNNNTFGSGCYSNTFAGGCHSNTFGNSCYSNTFGDSCFSITFGNSCYSNTFGRSCYSNTFGNSCHSNTFGDSCVFNTFGISCYSNTLLGGNDNNTFGSSCSYNTFGSSCSYNTFVAYCIHNTFGSSCNNNTFGSSCSYNIFGNSSQASDYYKCNIFDNGCSYIYLSSSDTSSSSSNYLQNVHIHLGVKGSSSSNRLSIVVPDRNLEYSTDYYADGSMEVYL